MVHKNAKRRVHSGNTLRASNSRSNRRYMRQSCLIRHSENVSNASSTLEDVGLDRDSVLYSLNKKGRWVVPQILKQGIINNCEEFEDIEISLFESHQLKKEANCTGFHCNYGTVRKIEPCKKTYFDPSSISGPKSEVLTPKMTFNVIYPCPATSSICHNPKYISYDKWTPSNVKMRYVDGKRDTDNSYDNTRSKKLKRKMGTKQRKTRNMYELEYLEEADYDTEYDSDYSDNQKTDVEASDVFASSPKASIHTVPMECVRICLPRMEVLTENLTDSYGDNYTECPCYPRKFIIDITQKLQDTLIKSKVSRNSGMRSVDLTAFLVFTYDVFGSFDNADTDTFKVFVNMKTKQQHGLKIVTLSENCLYSIEDIINKSITYIKTIPIAELEIEKRFNTHNKPLKHDFEILKESVDMSVQCLSPAYMTAQDILRYKDTTTFNDKFVPDHVGLLPPETCSICLETISDGSATALQSCGHWFCDRCWDEHLLSISNGGSCKVMCPQYQCSSTADVRVFLTTSNIKIVERVFRRKLSMYIETNESVKWCPNPKCGYAIQFQSGNIGKYLNSTCDCGIDLCFDCLMSAHWPATCAQYKSYLEMLKRNGDVDRSVDPDESKLVSFVRGKKCPSCQQFIEKEGGCFFMTCICGTHFCWGCNQPFDRFNEHTVTPYCTMPLHSTGDTYRTVRRRLHDVKKAEENREYLYKRAVQNRMHRHPSNIDKMSSAIRILMKTLKSLYCRRGDRLDEQLFDLETTKIRKDSSPIEKVRPFLDSMISVYVEVCHICEFLSVSMQDADSKTNHSSHRLMLIAARDDLEAFGREIANVFLSANNEDMTYSISRLWFTRIQCKHTIGKILEVLYS